MSTTIDYTKLAATLDYAAVEKKLEQLAQRDPPRKRKTVADVLVRIPVKVATGSGFMFPLIGAQRRWRLFSYESGSFESSLDVRFCRRSLAERGDVSVLPLPSSSILKPPAQAGGTGPWPSEARVAFA